MRLFVKLLLVVLTATGPSVCCCMAATIFHADFWHVHTATGLSTKATHRFCCYHSHIQSNHNRQPVKSHTNNGDAQPTVRSSEQSDQTPLDHQPCPCQDQRPDPVVSLAGEGGTRLNLAARDHQSPVFLLAIFVPHADTHHNHPGVALSSAPRLPFMSVDERLCAHHALRC